MTRTLLAALLLSLPAAAHGTEAASPAQAYRDLMRAQYAARQAPLPAGAEEAQRIHDAYLKTIGQPTPQHSSDVGAEATIPSR